MIDKKRPENATSWMCLSRALSPCFPIDVAPTLGMRRLSEWCLACYTDISYFSYGQHVFYWHRRRQSRRTGNMRLARLPDGYRPGTIENPAEIAAARFPAITSVLRKPPKTPFARYLYMARGRGVWVVCGPDHLARPENSQSPPDPPSRQDIPSGQFQAVDRQCVIRLQIFQQAG